MAIKIDSNVTGLRYAEEATLKTLPGTRASMTGAGALNTVIESTNVGGNDITVTLVGDSGVGAGVTISVVGRAVTIHYESAVSTVANVETAIGALAGANDLIGVRTPGTGATVLTAPGANFGPTALTGGAAPVWYPAEPNKYTDFGGKLATVARNPINPSRQRKKGTITDLEAAGGFESDLTQHNLTRLLQGFCFADAREKGSTAKLNTTAVPVTAVDGGAETYAVDNDPDLGFLVNHLVLASGFGVATNNGLKALSAVSTTLLTTTGLDAEATPPAAAKVEVVGYQFASETASIVMSGGLPRLTISGGFNPTTLGLIAGEWVYLGADAAANHFVNNTGFARVNAVAATYIEFDKTSWTPQAEASTGLTIRMFFGTLIRNEPLAANIKRRTYQLERTLGSDAGGVMSECLVGACPNELGLNVKQADKVTVDLSFVALDHEPRAGGAAGQAPGALTGPKSTQAGATAPDIVEANAFNTSSDVAYIRLSQVTAGNPSPTPLFAYGTDLQLQVKNNITALKAIGTLGGFETNTGTFEVSGKLTAYFADQTAIVALRNNADVTIDLALAKDNAGIVVDVPLISLGDGRLAIEQDKPVTLPLEMNAAMGKFSSTLTFNFFPYLPSVVA